MTLYGLWRSSSRTIGRRAAHLSTILPLSAIFSKLSLRRGRSAAFPRRFGLRPISSSSIISDVHEQVSLRSLPQAALRPLLLHSEYRSNEQPIFSASIDNPASTDAGVVRHKSAGASVAQQP